MSSLGARKGHLSRSLKQLDGALTQAQPLLGDLHINLGDVDAVRTAISERRIIQEDLTNQLQKIEQRRDAVYSCIDRLSDSEAQREALAAMEDMENALDKSVVPSEEACRELKIKLEMLNKELQRLWDADEKEKDRRARSVMLNTQPPPDPIVAPTAPAAGPAQPAPTQVSLPKLKLPRFDGNIFRWATFWDFFRDAIDRRRDLTDAQKMQYLGSCLEGDAKQAISSLAPIAANYPEALDLLKKRFGGEEVVRMACHTALQDLPHVPRNNVAKLRSFYDKMESHFRSLRSLGENVDQPFYKSLIQRKLPYQVQSDIYDQEVASNEPWTMTQWRDALGRLITKQETLSYLHKEENKSQIFSEAQTSQSDRYSGNLTRATAESLAVSEGIRRFPCIFCGGEHWPSECNTYRSAHERGQQIPRRCFICLKEGHLKKDCRGKRTCPHCKEVGAHHRSLCPQKFPHASKCSRSAQKDRRGSVIRVGPKDQTDNSLPTVENLVLNGRSDSSLTEAPTASESSMLISGESVLMQTALATVKSGKRSCQTRLFFDCGSTRTWCSEDLARKLNLPRERLDRIEISTFGTNRRVIYSHSSSLELKLLSGTMKIFVNIVPRMVDSMVRASVTQEEAKILRTHRPLADEILTADEKVPVDLLIGNDYYSELMMEQKKVIRPGLYVISSKLGWIVTGRSQQKSSRDTANLFSVGCCLADHTQAELGLAGHGDIQIAALRPKPEVDKFWDLETIGIRDSAVESDDDRALQNFNSTVEQKDGRYYVTFPWKDRTLLPPQNLKLAEGRLKSLIHRLKENPEHLTQYHAIIQDQEKKGIVEKVTQNTIQSDRIHYIPHHAVIRMDKKTTKIRIVYDASAKSKLDNRSLNDCLYRGQVFLENLVALLMRFRLHNVGIVADIEKAFHQVGLQTSERDVTRFLWLKDPSRLTTENNLQTYRFCRVPFGVISSPFLLGATLSYHLQSLRSTNASKLAENIYVDNLVISFDLSGEAVSFYGFAKKVLNKARMNLREWNSNSAEFLKSVSEADRAKVDETKVLGLIWNLKRDVLRIPSKIASTAERCKKRDVLSTIASIYDPLGFFGPAILKAKLFCQTLWEHNLDWNDVLTEEQLQTWASITEDLSLIPQQEISRRVGHGTSKQMTYELLCFCDASEKAYATALYLRQSDKTRVRVDLIFSKTRLAPQRRRITIPRLELMAVLIGVRAIQFVKTHLQITFESVVLWSDSQCVLHWLTTSRPLTIFVENRLREIKSHHDVFRFIATTDNPADIPTKGKSVVELMGLQSWWNGPPWLLQPVGTWPTWDSKPVGTQQRQIDENEMEMPTPTVSTHFLLAAERPTGKDTVSVGGLNPTRVSSLRRLLRVTAWILRFLNRIRTKEIVRGELKPIEIEKAKLLWLKGIQEYHFIDLLQSLERKGSKPQLVTQLGLKKDSDGLLRCHGRIGNSDLSQAAKTPILLPRNDYFTKLVIEDSHERVKHFGVTFTLADLRQEYWIPKGRMQIERILKDCKRCRKLEGGPYKLPGVPALPSCRVKPSAPFTYTGLDYLGPLHVKGKGKAWICLFTCLGIRAVHLELIQDLSAEQFLMALRRFIARRGRPRWITLDNASQFKLGKDTFDRAWTEVITDPSVEVVTTGEGIQWKFIPEHAPWMGGFYERLVGLTKRALRKSVGRNSLTYTQLETLLTEIEMILNERPLTFISGDINSNEVLTPAHFLGVRRSRSILPLEGKNCVDPDSRLEDLNSRDRLLESWKQTQAYLNKFWTVWKDEYLLNLRERHVTVQQARFTSVLDSAIGDTVLVKADAPRLTWKMGRIASLTNSADGKTRSATVRLANGNILKRSLSHLFPLEVGECLETEAGLETMPNLPKGLQPIPARSLRTAAIEAREKIRTLAQDQSSDNGES